MEKFFKLIISVYSPKFSPKKPQTAECEEEYHCLRNVSVNFLEHLLLGYKKQNIVNTSMYSTYIHTYIIYLVKKVLRNAAVG